MKNCLNCKYEPDWSEFEQRGEYAWCHVKFGICKWNKTLPQLPQCYSLSKNAITRNSDDSGIMLNCKAWEKK